MNHRLLSLLGLSLLLGCQAETGKEKETAAQTAVDLKTELPGTWEFTTLRIDVNSFENRDTSLTFEVLEENWERQYQAKPPRTIFDNNNRYRREYRALSGDTISVSRGLWNAFGDSLMLVEPDTSYQFQVRIANGLAEYRRLVDWDGDGQIDDNYLEIHRRISRDMQ